MPYIPILTYHRLLRETPSAAADPKRIAVSQSQFRSHMALLKRRGYRTLSLGDYIKTLREGHKPPAKSFAITFDDGYVEVLTLALPILREMGFTATVFAVAGQLGGSNAWDDSRASLLTPEQFLQWQKSGMTIGAHTLSHVRLPQSSLAVARMEINESKSRLETALGQKVTLLAYPYGESNPTVEGLVKEAGFTAAFATDRAPRNHAVNLFCLRRVVIFPRTNAWELLWKVQTWYPAYQDWRRGS